MERSLKKDLWGRLADECLAAAGVCLGREHWRSVVNRAYYAMFAASTRALLSRGATPRPIWGTWSHEQIPDVVHEQLQSCLRPSVVSQVRKHVRMGRQLREMADYDPAVTVDDETAKRAFGYASAVTRALRDM